MRARRIDGPVPDRFWPKVDTSAGPDACWPWTASLTPDGYGRMSWHDGDIGAHRLSWILAHGMPVPDGLVIDHLCRVRHCVNPAHLEAVTQQLNLRRGVGTNAAKTHCPSGHEYTDANTYRACGRRLCRTCRGPTRQDTYI